MMILAAILAWAAALGADNEHLAAPALHSFVVGNQASDISHGMAIREEVPAGQTVLEWSRMVTTQRMGDLAAKISVFAFVQGMADRLPASCPGITTTPVEFSIMDGHAAARMEANCPRLPETGKPETFLILAVAGPRDIHVKQVALRGEHSVADLAWARSFLDKVRFCPNDERSGVCAN